MPSLTAARLAELEAAEAKLKELQDNAAPDQPPDDASAGTSEKVDLSPAVEGATHTCVFGAPCACTDGVEGHGCPRDGHVQADVCLAAMESKGGDASGSHKCVAGHWCSCEEQGGSGINGHGCPTPQHQVVG